MRRRQWRRSTLGELVRQINNHQRKKALLTILEEDARAEGLSNREVLRGTAAFNAGLPFEEPDLGATETDDLIHIASPS